MSRLAHYLLIAAVAAPLLVGCGAARNNVVGPQVALPSKANVRSTPVRPVTTPTMTGGTTSVANGSFITQVGAVSPTFSPRGDRLAFSNASRGILFAEADGSKPQALRGTVAGDTDPAWSPAGDSIVLVRPRLGGGSTLMRIEGADGRAVTLADGPETFKSPTWAPGARGLVFVAEQGTQATLYRLVLDGSKPVVLWNGAAAASPTISADGRLVVFEHRTNTGETGLARIGYEGGALEPLNAAGKSPRRPAFSPSGRSIAYVADDGLYIAQADGHNGVRVAAAAGLDTPLWHPSLPQVIVSATQGGRRDLMRIALPSK